MPGTTTEQEHGPVGDCNKPAVHIGCYQAFGPCGNLVL